MTAVVLGLTWLALRLSAPLGRALGRTGVNVVTRVPTTDRDLTPYGQYGSSDRR